MKEYTLNECFDLIRNGASIKQFKASGIPITRIETISSGIIDYSKVGYADIFDDKYSDFYLKENDILMSHINSEKHLGKVAIVKGINQKIIHGMNLLILRYKKDIIYPKYIYYYFKTNKFKLNIFKISKKSVNQASFNVSELKKIRVFLPNTRKQQEISEKLDKVTEIIKKQKEQLELLENLKKSQFFELFGDPIKNEKGWRIEKWKNLFKIQTGKLNSNAMVEGGKYPFFTCAKEIFSIDKYYFDCEALILAGNNADGIYDVKYYNGKFNAYQRTYVINLINKEYNYIFFKFLLESKLKYLKEISKGSSTRYLTMSILSNLKFILPETSLQNKFATKIEAIQKLKFEIEKSLKETENLYNSLMQKFFSNK